MAEFGTPETWNMKVGDFIETQLPKEKPQALLDLQEQNRKQRLLDTLQKIGPGLMDESLDFIRREELSRGSGRVGFAKGGVQLLTPGIIKTKELYDLLIKAGLNLPEGAGNASRIARVYGLERPKEVTVQYTGQSPTILKNPKQFYIKPTESQLKEIKKQYDINQLKKTSSGPGKEAFELRKKRATELLKTGKYSIAQVNEIIKKEFPTQKGMKTTIGQLAKNIKGVPSGVEGDTATMITKVKKDLEKLNKSEVKDLLKAGNKNLQSLINKTSKILGRDKSLATRRIGQLIEAYRGDDRYLKVKDDLLVRRVQPLIKGLGKIEGTKLFGGIGGGLQRMAAEGESAKSMGKTRTFFASLRKRIQEALPKSGYETDEIKNIRSSARFGTGPYSMFVQGIKSDINQDKMKTLDKQTSIYEKRLQAAKPEDKPKIAEEYNTKARKFAAEANKNLKPGQPPVRVLEISFDEPNKFIKNKYALDNYGYLFDDIYKKHGYSFKVPADVKTIEEIKPFLEGGRGLKKAAQLIRAGAPRIFGIPAAAYLSYQALEGEATADEPGFEDEDDSILPEAAVATAAAAPLATKKGRSIYGTAGKGLLKTLQVLGQPSIAAGIAADELRKGNIKTGGAALLAPELAGSLAPAGRGILSTIGRVAANPFGRFARAFTPVGLATIGAGALKDVYDEYQRREALTDEERLAEDIERDRAADEMMVGAAEGGRIGFADGPKDPSKRKFMKLMGILSLLPFGIGKGFKMAEKAAPVVAEGAKLGFDNFIKLVAKIKAFGKEDPARTTLERQKATTYTGKDGSEYELIEDMGTGDIRITKDRPGVAVYGRGTDDVEGIDVIEDKSTFEFKVGQADETTKGKKPPDEYEEGKLESFDGETFDAVDDVDDQTVKEILDEID